MQNRDKTNRRLIELLWIEINRAIISSQNVQETISNLKKLNLLDDVKEHSLVLDVNKLIELASLATDDKTAFNDKESESYPGTFEFDDGNPDLLPINNEVNSPQETIASEGDKPQYIDGKLLSKNQIQFQEFQAQQFDEEIWLKKNKIYF